MARLARYTAADFNAEFRNDDLCLEYIREQRWPAAVTHCVKCGNRWKHHRVTGRTAYACGNCGNQIYPLAGTIFAKSRMPLKKWFYMTIVLKLSLLRIVGTVKDEAQQMWCAPSPGASDQWSLSFGSWSSAPCKPLAVELIPSRFPCGDILRYQVDSPMVHLRKHGRTCWPNCQA